MGQTSIMRELDIDFDQSIDWWLSLSDANNSIKTPFTSNNYGVMVRIIMYLGPAWHLRMTRH